MARIMAAVRCASMICLSSAWFESETRADQPTHPVPIPDSSAAVSRLSIQPRLGLDPRVGRNVRCNSRTICPNGRGKVQSEVAIAASGDTILCGYNDSRGYYCPELGYSTNGWAYSLNGGASFTDGVSLPTRPTLGGDPWMVSFANGTFAYSALGSRSCCGLALFSGAAGAGRFEWSDPDPLSLSGSVLDKESMAVDPNSGTLFLVFTRVPGEGSGIWLYRSDDDGASFEGPFAVFLAKEPFGGPVTAIGVGGEVNVAWYSSDHISFAQSLDGGRTFGQRHYVGVNCPVAAEYVGLAYPQIAVDLSQSLSRGNIYVVWHSSCDGGSGNVVLARSTDDGASWSVPRVVNDDHTGAVHFYPTVSVDHLGRVNIFFYDRRENPGTSITNLYFAQSLDGALQFQRNFRVTEVASEWQPSDMAPLYGDYITSLSVGRVACVGYADGRDGDPDAYFTCVTSND